MRRTSGESLVRARGGGSRARGKGRVRSRHSPSRALPSLLRLLAARGLVMIAAARLRGEAGAMPARKHDRRLQHNLGRDAVIGETGFTPWRGSNGSPRTDGRRGNGGRPRSPRAPARAVFAQFVTLATRWSDNDAYGHLNNVIYYALFNSAVNTISSRRGCSIRRRVRSSAWSSRAAGGSTRASPIPSRRTSASLLSTSAASRCAPTSQCSKPALRPPGRGFPRDTGA